MPKIAKELSDISIKRLRHRVGTGEKNSQKKGKPIKAMHAVGGVSGLYLQCLPPRGSEKVGARQWIYRATVGNKVRNIGLGSYPSVPTKSARKAARELLDSIKSGIDPVSEKKAKLSQLRAMQTKEITFEEFARQRFIPKESLAYKSAPHADVTAIGILPKCCTLNQSWILKTRRTILLEQFQAGPIGLNATTKRGK